MLYSKDREEMRAVFRQAWRKYQNNEPLEKIEGLIAELIALHPEYHTAINNVDHDDGIAREHTQQAFMHLSLHLAIREQISMNQPHGIRELYDKALKRRKDPLEAEHILMDALYEMMTRAENSPTGLDDQLYLALINQRVSR